MEPKNRKNNRAAAKAAAVLRQTDDGFDLRLSGVVGDNWAEYGFDDTMVDDVLAGVTGPGVVRINSPGGAVFDGIAVHSMLAKIDGLTVRVEGLAASIASVIALAGSRVEMERGAMMMIHNPWNIAMGDSQELRKSADVLDQIKESLIDIYVGKSGLERDFVAEMMDEETWLSADEAVEFGFADAVVGATSGDPEDRIQSLDLSILANAQHAPARIAALATASASRRKDRASEPANPKSTTEEPSMTDKTTQDPAAPGNAPAPEARTDNPTGDDAAAKAAAEAVAAERNRCSEIKRRVAENKLDPAFAEQLIDDGVELPEAKQRITMLANYLQSEAGKAADALNGVHGIEITRDERDTQTAGASKAILNRFNPRQYAIEGDDPAREFAGMRLFEMARMFAERSGQNVKGRNVNEIARAALHTTSDFPAILENVIGKALRDRYDLAPRTFLALASQSTLPDYKQVSRVQLGEAPVLAKVLEGGEYEHGTIGDAAEKYQLFKYGKILSVSREVIINDDLDAITRIPASMGAAAGQLENQLFWAHLTGNPTMHDGTALFATGHGNLDNSGATISVASIGAGREAMRKQKGLDGEHFINVTPSTLVVPAALETTAEQFVSTNLVPESSGNINPFAGRLSVISEPRLDADDANAWYLFADPNMVDTLEYAYLQGEEGPQIETKDGFEVDGMQVKVRHNFGVKALDWRGIYKNVGA